MKIIAFWCTVGAIHKLRYTKRGGGFGEIEEGEKTVVLCYATDFIQ